MEKNQQLIDCLKPRGFSYNASLSSPKYIVLSGGLNTSHDSYLVDVFIDRAFFGFPKVQLREIPDKLLPVAPHISATGEICYVQSSIEVVDIFNPIGVVLSSIARAEEVLDDILSGELENNLVEEFYAFWPIEILCFSDVELKVSGNLTLVFMKKKNFMLITDDLCRSSRKIDSLGGYDRVVATDVKYIVTKFAPRPLLKKWPPKNVQDILDWQNTIDKNCSKKIKAYILDCYRRGGEVAFVIVKSPDYLYAFMVLDLQKIELSPIERIARTPVYNLKVDLLGVIRIDDEYLIGRNNLSRLPLSNKRIVIVGCGTIGGYLTEMLVKLGAGTFGGKLSLVDVETLQPGNIGRHYLGFDSLFEHKSEALKFKMISLMPSAIISSHPVDAREMNFSSYDLIIDCTGEEALSNWMAKSMSKTKTILHVWIEGGGTAVRTLLSTPEIGSCYHCLSLYNKNNEYKALVENIETVFDGHGCEGLFIPFSSSISIQAAILGSDAVIAWANDSGFDEPSLTTKVIDKKNTLATVDCWPPKHRECQVCM